MCVVAPGSTIKGTRGIKNGGHDQPPVQGRSNYNEKINEDIQCYVIWQIKTATGKFAETVMPIVFLYSSLLRVIFQISGSPYFARARLYASEEGMVMTIFITNKISP
ncbi:hypothetical protein BMT52_09810 [Escherichia coli]|uniref:Uncharacterized protein n=1 Tax=Escherichia coli TaxID=562 RepID=A0AAP7TV42_ECOLX|nr:hypothetical protein AML34_26060 [Escherichia coli]OKB72804.1 hypothetical protein BMT50_08505 [Escherichia coli]OKB85177.1 hypothetical protein BMT52_09810 [Escherichia coli]OKB93353.1 hypothetical protein BMT51_01945 [Escherichia coli]